ncbi:dynamin family protein [Alicyclobacillus acidocaldarius]|uniref:Small GTP-binding protein n=1 Tax=Alicyclobacillus acidocaldarius subsp. acidocaldarius (strain ATCC 27009 / DSM 446 / BCRC 14685 / JCM 5260 / KCTC 1825 / NBRC 15652 / NCIMB 11725 / NRRL B-14509 / 104-IA) TaxID=521098 RepID=C8WV19_ALIAD|nr:dynamin family protein [Alicyclobacillus acidocaldarius]ACV58008.1 small GTP-binding protein [Alicyclobacillus acidocaldarius subsp. acidocaldarius DSM 446]
MSSVSTTAPRFAQRFLEVADWLEAEGASQYADRIRSILADSGAVTTYTAAFCGLFSAGKSSLVGALAGKRLKTGANPTTAEVEAVEVEVEGGTLRLLDTPGIDSTDERHREATMNALYQADLVAVVTDYQHVEADANLELLQMFAVSDKPLLFIVHQVDKHLEAELPFEAFAESVRELAADYGVDASRVFFTAVRPSAHSQLDELRAFLVATAEAALGTDGEPMIRRLVEVAREGVSACYESEWEKRAKAVEEISGRAPQTLDEAREWLWDAKRRAEALAQEEAEQRQRLKALVETLRDGWLRAVDLAQIAPYETAEKGRRYIDSLRADFKVGVFRSTKKTEAEREARLKAFVDDLAEKVENFLTRPLSAEMAQHIREVGLQAAAEERLIERCQGLRVRVDAAYVQACVKPGSLVSAEYGHQFVRDVQDRVRREMRAQVQEIGEALSAAVEERIQMEERERAPERDAAERWCQVLRSYVEFGEQYESALAAVTQGEVPRGE